ncbi:undecaprenyl-diphosphate phosphatase [Porphyromonadaceae bacterium OttesenSCG-928-L07]|nr:undecaprenyl-diphosphate phosphatase [Porphyromonadaceae bacterium OttesenSCG-928-L07]MDL2331099.1 undecaprenyl-diphosphate phosphatase [Odoribacter sp. OttesenSCG-928-A06]
MTWIEALVLGIVQGLTEFLPVSSSGHLQIFKEILGVEITSDLTFEVIVHAATVCSTIVVLHKEIWSLLKGFFQFRMNEETLFILKIVVSMIPVAIVGFCFKDQVEQIFGEGLVVVGSCLLITACLLAFAYYAKPRLKTKIPFLDAFVIGVSQAIAVLPGLSRSGSTIATGILLGNNKEKVAKFSFLMVLIPILGEAFLESLKILSGNEEAVGMVAQTPVFSLIVGFVAAFLSGLVACRWMINLVAKGKLIWFAVYCLIVGLVVLFW